MPIIRINGIGPVLFERSRRAKHLNISIKPYEGVRVAVPYGVTLKKAEEIVYTRVIWIRKNLARMKAHEEKQKTRISETPPVTRSFARQILVDRLDELAEKHGYSYNRVFIRNQRTRWGSCSTRNNINLNINLIHLPKELMDYVFLHELVHTRNRNHSKDFWAELDRLTGDVMILQKRLKEYSL